LPPQTLCNTAQERGIKSGIGMSKPPLTVCVVGGGFTGAAAAIACLSHLKAPFRLVMIEGTTALGRGLAYGSHHPLNLLNVRTRDLSIRAGQPGDFLNWAFRQLDQGENQAGLHEALAHTFLPRQLFGEYVRQRLFESVERRPDVGFTVFTARARAVTPESGRYRIELDRAEPITADVVMLATAYGLQQPRSTGALAPFEIVSAERTAEASSIMLIGSGLTMVDVLLSARRDGFQGNAIVISRRGQLPRTHAPKGVLPQQVAIPHSKRVSLLAASIRIACEMAEGGGTPWQAIINGLRPSIQDIWQGLPREEQARFLRHLRPFWDAHRHRLPMEVHGRLRAEFGEGRAVLLRGAVKEVAREGDRFAVTLQKRGARHPETIATDLAYDCSGFRPDLGQPLVTSLLAQGLACSDPHHLGLVVERNGQVIGARGEVTNGLFAIGPLCQGTLWEINAVPEIVTQADQAAQSLACLYETTPAAERLAVCS
jgi:uncharacterized NAD(P)/FAD-binding protein YdhS